MATEWISPTWRMPEESNQSKFENYSLEFNGTDEIISCGVISELASATNFSLSGWFYFDSVANNKTLYSYGGTGTNYGITVQTHASGNLIFVIASATNDSGSNYIQTNLASVLTTSTWYHIVCTYDGSQAGNTDKAKIYINGTEVAYAAGGGTIPATTSASTGPFNIGQWDLGGSNRFFDGEIGRVSVYGSTLTPTQITALYNSGTPVNPMALTPLPIAYYPLGGRSTGDASDPATTLTIPNSSVPSATVFNFTGSSEHVLLPQLNTTGAYTISCWVKSTGANYQMIYNEDEALRTPSGSDRNFFWTIAFGKIRWANWFTSGYQQVESSNTINDGEWHHTLGVWDGTTNTGSIKVFIDGILRGTATAGATTRENHTMANNSSIIGGQNSSYDFDGEMANFQVWTTGLSYGSASSSGDTAGGDVATIYNNGVPLYTGTQPESSSLKFWNKLNVDTSTWNGNDWVIGDSTADYPTCLQFDGSSGVNITSPSSPYLPKFSEAGDISISFWMRTDKDIPGSYNRQFPVGCWHSISSTGSSLGAVSHYFTDWSKTIARVGNSYGSTKLNDGNWHHIVYTFQFSDGQAYGYVDGNSTAEVSQILNNGATLYWALYIGGFGFNNTYDFDGQVSNVLYYNKVITGSEATTLYNNGVPQTSPSFSPDGWWKCDNLTTGIQDSAGSNNGTNDGAVVSNIPVSLNNGLSSGMTTANLVNSDLTRSIPYSSYSMALDGTADYINCGTSAALEIAGDVSISAWVYITTGSIYNSIIAKRDSGGTNYQFYTDNSATPLLRFYDGTTATSSTGAVSLNAWHHVAITVDSGVTNGSIFYIDGVASGTGTWTITSDDADLLIGALDNGSIGSYFTGSLSNTAVFNSVLSQDQILTIYNGGVPNSISNLSPVGWWSLAGDSYFNGNDWICPDLGGGGNNGTSSGMGGTELVGNGPGSTANGIATSMNIPGNLQGNAPNSSKNAFSINMTAIDRIDYDAEAKAFINAAGITDATQQLAIKTLVSSLQSDNLWTNMKAIYPMVGGTSTTHKYNLRNPLDSDAGFRLVFDGGWTHSATGATPGGVNGRANSHLVPSNDISSKDAMSFGYYSRDTSDANGLGYDMGSYQAGDISILVIKYVNLLWYSINQNTYTRPANTNTDGFFVSNRSASNAIQVYRNGSSFHTAGDLSTDLSAADFGIGGIYGTPGYGNKECAFAFIYDGSLDATQNLNLYNAVQAFNTTLGRQV